MRRFTQWCAVLGGALVCATSASAAYVPSFGQVQNPDFLVLFQGDLGAPNTARNTFLGSASMGMQNFEGLLGATGSFSIGSIGVTTSVNVVEPPISALGSGDLAPDADIDGSRLFSVNSDLARPAGDLVPSDSTRRLIKSQVNNSTVTIDLEFSQALMAFGFYAVDVGDFTGQMSVELFDQDNNSIGGSRNVPHAQEGTGGSVDGNVLFYGLRAAGTGDTPFTKVRVTYTSTGVDVFGLDNLYAGTRSNLFVTNPPPSDVPEPGSIALAGLALAALGARARRRR